MLPVLLVEDDPGEVAFVREVIEDLSLINRLDVATSAAAARLYLARLTPTLIISNVHLPREDGIELLQWVRARPAPLGDVPVVFLTVRRDRIHELHASTLRPLLVLAKPIERDVLLDALRGLGLLVTDTRTGRVLSIDRQRASPL
jgi:CheY-like chemotaxis protein